MVGFRGREAHVERALEAPPPLELLGLVAWGVDVREVRGQQVLAREVIVQPDANLLDAGEQGHAPVACTGHAHEAWRMGC